MGAHGGERRSGDFASTQTNSFLVRSSTCRVLQVVESVETHDRKVLTCDVTRRKKLEMQNLPFLLRRIRLSNLENPF